MVNRLLYFMPVCKMKSMKNTSLIISMCLCLCGCAPAGSAVQSALPDETAEPTPSVQTYHASLFMVGDALLHDGVYEKGMQLDGSYDFTSMIHRVKDIAEPYDLAYYNQESILGGTELGLSSYPCFNSPKEWGRDMVDAGFNLVSTANNHALDKGAEGIQSSLSFWKQEKGVIEDGTYTNHLDQQAIPIHEINGIRYAFISYTYGTNGIPLPENQPYLVNTLEKDTQPFLDKVKAADSQADVVIAAVHWGTEYVNEPTEAQKALAQQLSDCGADIIIGSHPHVIEPYARIGNAVCFYSLGNFISSQQGTEKNIGMDAALDIVKTVEDGMTSISIENVRADLLYCTGYGNAYEIYPFEQLDDSLLNGHQDLYAQYTGIITEMNDSIRIGGI